MKDKKEQFGIITEQGDLGLGFSIPKNKEEQEKIKKTVNKSKQ